MLFQDRTEAGQMLAERLKKYQNDQSAMILAVPRGGIVTGKQIADVLHLPLDVIVTKKIGCPGNPEFAIGSVAPDGTVLTNPDYQLFADEDYIKEEAERLKEEIQKKLKNLRGDRPLPELKDKNIILTDDGIATGFTMKAAIEYLRKKEVKKIILAVPVAPPESVEELRPLVDELIVLDTPAWFGAVGQFYQNFAQVEDEEVQKLLQ